VIKYHQFGVMPFDRGQNFFGLAAPDKQLGFRCGTRAGYRGNADCPGRINQFGEFLQILLACAIGKKHVDQNGPFTAIRAFEQTNTPSCAMKYQAFPG
jgi:hypothetical protein